MSIRSLSYSLLLLALAALTLPSSGGAAPEAPSETLLLQNPDISADHVCFVYANDLWIADRTGGAARRLTSSSGRETTPRFSPDGQWIAFTGQYDGNYDVYVISIHGGLPRRLTWHPGLDAVRDWHPDGKRVLFASSRVGGTPSWRLFHVDAEGGFPTRLPIPRVSSASYRPTGTHIAYTPLADATRTWKRYRGGRTGPVWIYDVETHDVEEIPRTNATDTQPCWIGDTVYFRSDRDNQNNIYAYVPGSKKVEQITRFKDIGVRSLQSGDGLIVFTQGGAIRTYDPKTDGFEKLSITCSTDGLYRRSRWQSAGRPRNADISPTGKRAVLEMRGEIFTVPYKDGPTRNLSNSPGAHDRDPRWSPDGSQIAWFTDERGEYELVLRDRLGREEKTFHKLDGAGFYFDPVWSPDGKHIIFSDKGNRLAYLTLETGKITEINTSQGALGVWRPFGVWSPDGKWIAYELKNPRTSYNSVGLYEVATGKKSHLTDHFSDADSPAFSRDGKYLFFRASTDSGPRQFGLDMTTSTVDMPTTNLYVAVLKKSLDNPLAPTSDDEPVAKKKADKQEKKDAPEKDAEKPSDEKKKAGEGDEPGDDKKADDKKADEKEDAGEDKDSEDQDDDKKQDDQGKADEKKKDAARKVEKPSIDLEGLDQRILALPIPSGQYWNLVCTKNRLLFIDQGRGLTLKSFDFKSKKARDITKGVRGVRVSAKGTHILINAGRSVAIGTESGGNRRNLELGAARVRIVPEAEWRQILRETWRLQRDFFYDENMHGVDWDAMWERWSAFLPHVQHRADLSLLQSELIGELACGHEYVSGGDAPGTPGGVPVGLLGCDFEVVDGHYKITRIYRGQNWNPRLRAPLTEPGIDVREGDFLISVNGMPLTASMNVYEAFEQTAGVRTRITVASSPTDEKKRVEHVVPLGNDGGLRSLAWVESRRRRVHEKSNGRIAYIYMPNTGGGGIAAFDRDYYSQLHKDALIIDERYNGGGKVADYVIHRLQQEVMAYWMNREKWLARTPFSAFDGPKAMIINESAGSGGDAMPWMFKQQELGTLVGTRTWGGLVGISGYPPLMDGGSVTAANFGIMDPEGNWVVENVGVAPDVEVVEYPKPIIENGADPQLDKTIEILMKQLESWEKQPEPTYKPPSKR